MSDLIPQAPVPPLRPAADWRAAIQKLSWTTAYEYRARYIEEFGFPILTQEVVQQLARFINARRTLEIGAGTGILSRYLADEGVSIEAIDSKVGSCTQPIWWENDRPQYYNVRQQDALELDSYPADVIILSWPCYDTDFANQVLQRMTPGQFLIYQGESQGGCTANNAFFDTLDRDFAPMELRDTNEPSSEDWDGINTHHVRFNGIYDCWSIYRKKGYIRLPAPTP